MQHQLFSPYPAAADEFRLAQEAGPETFAQHRDTWITKRELQEMKDLKFAWSCVKHVKSNAHHRQGQQDARHGQRPAQPRKVCGDCAREGRGGGPRAPPLAARSIFSRTGMNRQSLAGPLPLGRLVEWRAIFERPTWLLRFSPHPRERSIICKPCASWVHGTPNSDMLPCS